MLASLSVCEVGTVVLVNGQTEATFEASDMVLEDIRVLVEIDSFECELAKTFTTIGICG